MRTIFALGLISILVSCSAGQQAQVAQACHVASAVEAQDPKLVDPTGKVGSKIVEGQTLVCLVNGLSVPQTAVAVPAPMPAAAP